ncbi:FtsX-like permease family protein [Nonomuraea sp. NEAU-A123]|uniref:FtsX-like permease family protein n=1 Tax=Nonomuraea sp. NEAU-A123 TaxID=2839649 RepID=UPI001BE4BBBD|nr:FtsX-like permease family protein [Nonomuraea sp. NEAU-A123]MBT2229541.1 hypothetical protein [Nonomuraea sp. NEAU-A123]
MRILLLARVRLGAVAVLSLLTLSACLLVAGLPRVLQGAYDDALHRALQEAPAQQADLSVRTESRGALADLHEPGQFATQDARLRSLVPPRLRPLVSATGQMSAKTYDVPVNESNGLTYINLAWLSDGDRRVEWIDGRAPGKPGVLPWNGSEITLFEVGIVDEARATMGLKIGDVRILGESDQIAAKVVGVFRAKDPGARYWSHDVDVLHVTQVQPPGQLEMERRTTALIPASGLAVLNSAHRNLVYNWILPVDPAAPASLDVPELRAAVEDYRRLIPVQMAGNGSQYRLETDLPGLLDRFGTALGTAQTVMFLVLGGLLAVALGVLVLAVQLLTERIDHPLALARARGGSLRQVAGAGAALVAIAVAPAALAGWALAFLVPGPVPWVAHAGPALVPLTAVGYAAARLSVTHRAPLHERRDDVAAARPSARRITLEVLVVGLALAGAYLLRTRGLTTGGQDPFLLLVPVALTVAAALITIRCYPLPLKLLVRLAARGRLAVPFLGLTRAARARSASALPVLILLPALAVSVFGAVISGGLSATQRLASWQSVGAPIKLTSPVELPPDAIERVRKVPGVRLLVPAQTASAQIGYGGERAQIIAVDLGQWRRLLDGAPISLPAIASGTSGIPVLVSHELRGRGTFEIGWYERMKVTTAGEIAALPGFYPRGKFIVLPFETNERPGVNTLLIRGDADPAALLAATGQPTAQVTTQERALAAIEDDPLTGTVQDVLLITTAALAVYALIAVVVTLVIGAADRARALSFLRTLGLSDRQARGLTVLEILPLILITSLAGLALGLGLPAALGPAIDLSSYTGDLAVGDYSADPVLPVVLAGGLAAVAVLGAYAHTAISRRRNLGAVLRVGDLT